MSYLYLAAVDNYLSLVLPSNPSFSASTKEIAVSLESRRPKFKSGLRYHLCDPWQIIKPPSASVPQLVK